MKPPVGSNTAQGLEPPLRPEPPVDPELPPPDPPDPEPPLREFVAQAEKSSATANITMRPRGLTSRGRDIGRNPHPLRH
jgi:hypothetical protein